MSEFWERTLLEPLRELGQQAVSSLSSLLGVTIFIVLGLGIGWLMKEGIYRSLRALRFDRLCDRLGIAPEVERLGLAKSCSYLAGQVVQGIILLAALLAGLNALGTQWTRGLVERFFLYLPHMLAALMILVVGTLVSRFLGRSVLIAAVNARMHAGGSCHAGRIGNRPHHHHRHLCHSVRWIAHGARHRLRSGGT
jgi:hypothetical protein